MKWLQHFHFDNITDHLQKSSLRLCESVLFTFPLPYDRNKRASDYLFCLFPDLRLSQVLLWSCGEVEFEREAKHVVDSAQEVQAAFDLFLNLGSKTKCKRTSIISFDIATRLISHVMIAPLFVLVFANN